ncbi:hypothetical protein PybrP1_002088 [[Pythium] brassicae (nom. inval.)]|nr:hypothetical protein PybrP1_002088 [[Pythium] brassicae (nom. inval.)]
MCSGSTSRVCDGPAEIAFETGHTHLLSDASSPSDTSQFVVMESEADGIERLHTVDTAEAKEKTRARVLSTLPLLALAFFATCGGPISSESIITASGPAVGFIALLVFPVLFFVPMCFVVTELVSAIPDAGGHAYWIALAFGPQCGFQAGYWTWVANCVSCALISSLTVSFFADSGGSADRSTAEEIVRQGLPILLALPGFFSLRRVGQIVSVLFLVVFVIYLTQVISGAVAARDWNDIAEVRYTDGSFASLFATRSSSQSPRSVHVDVVSLLSNLTWSYHGFHNVSVFATEVQDPAKTYRHVMFVALALVPLTYLVPMVVAVATSDPKWTEWVGNSVADIFIAFGGTAMHMLAGVLLACSVVGLYLMSLLSSAFLATGMVSKRFGPLGVGMNNTSVQATPQSAIFFSLPVMLIMVNLELDDMARIANAFGGLGSLMLVLAAIRLRFTQKKLPRPTKLCGDAHPAFMVAALLVPIACLALSTAYAFSSLISAVLTSVLLFIGLVYGWQANFSHFER